MEINFEPKMEGNAHFLETLLIFLVCIFFLFHFRLYLISFICAVHIYQLYILSFYRIRRIKGTVNKCLQLAFVNKL